MAETTSPKTPISLLVPRDVDVEVRRIAKRDDLSVSDVVRQLLRRGLADERRTQNGNGNEAA